MEDVQKNVGKYYDLCGAYRKLLASMYRSFAFATDPEVRVRFPALPDFLRSSGSETGSTQPHEFN
jgi:hypothetical protein